MLYITIALILMILFAVWRELSKPKLTTKYHMLSTATKVNMGRDIYDNSEVYLLDSNGIVIDKEGLMSWFADQQRFEKSKFKLCVPGKTFSLIYHTLSGIGTELLAVEHVYKAVEQGDYIVIQWQSQQTITWNDDYQLVQVPKDFVPAIRPNKGTYVDSKGKTCTYVTGMEAGDKFSITFTE